MGGELKGRGKTIFYASLKNKEKFLNPLTPTLSHGMGRGSHWSSLDQQEFGSVYSYHLADANIFNSEFGNITETDSFSDEEREYVVREFFKKI